MSYKEFMSKCINKREWIESEKKDEKKIQDFQIKHNAKSRTDEKDSNQLDKASNCNQLDKESNSNQLTKESNQIDQDSKCNQFDCQSNQLSIFFLFDNLTEELDQDNQIEMLVQ